MKTGLLALFLLIAQDDSVKVPAPEFDAAKAVEVAPDIESKLAAAAEFVTQYPNSSVRSRVANYLMGQIYAINDPNRKLAAVHKAATIFTQPSEADQLKPAMVDAFIGLTRINEAFKEGQSVLAQSPDDVQMLVNLAILGAEQAKRKNPKFASESRLYGLRAIELLEADKKPGDMDPEIWARYKRKLPELYQETAVVSLMENNPADAQARLERAVKLNPTDPFNYVLLGTIVNEEYQRTAENYKGMAAGKAKNETLQKALTLVDKLIDLYAHGVALAEGKPAYQQLHDQVLQDLTSFYRFRHKTSTEGLQELIDSYK